MSISKGQRVLQTQTERRPDLPSAWADLSEEVTLTLSGGVQLGKEERNSRWAGLWQRNLACWRTRDGRAAGAQGEREAGLDLGEMGF